MTAIRYAGNPNSFSFGMNAGTRARSRTRVPNKGEARVEFLSADGKLLQEKIGTVDSKGRCWVRFEGAQVQATQGASGWVYKLPAKVEE